MTPIYLVSKKQFKKNDIKYNLKNLPFFDDQDDSVIAITARIVVHCSHFVCTHFFQLGSNGVRIVFGCHFQLGDVTFEDVDLQNIFSVLIFNFHNDFDFEVMVWLCDRLIIYRTVSIIIDSGPNREATS